MYHSHQDAVKQVSNALAGAFLVGDEPAPAGVVPSQNQIMMLNDSGTLGLTINGKSFPATAPVVAWHCHILSHAEREDGMFGMVTAFIVKP